MSDWSKAADAAKAAAGNDLQDTTDIVKSSARAAAQTIKDSAGDALSRSSDLVRDGADRLASAGGGAADTLARQIRNQPVTAAMVCLGVGLLAGLVIARRGL
ncbi:MAG TPA: hypothetical protein VIJ78_03340 [Pseudolabrys sp.]